MSTVYSLQSTVDRTDLFFIFLSLTELTELTEFYFFAPLKKLSALGIVQASLTLLLLIPIFPQITQITLILLLSFFSITRFARDFVDTRHNPNKFGFCFAYYKIRSLASQEVALRIAQIFYSLCEYYLSQNYASRN